MLHLTAVDTEGVVTAFEVEQLEPSVLLIRFPPVFDPQGHRSLLASILRDYKSEGQLLVFVDMRHARVDQVSSQHREAAVAARRDYLKAFEGLIVCEIRIVSNPIIRAVTTLVDSELPMPWTVYNVGTVELAESLAQGKLAKLGLPSLKTRLDSVFSKKKYAPVISGASEDNEGKARAQTSPIF